MISGSWMNTKEREAMSKNKRPIGRGRTTVNKAISRIRMMFRWGKVRKLVPAEVITDLDCLPFLKPGEGGANEYDPIEAVPLAVVEATLPHLAEIAPNDESARPSLNRTVDRSTVAIDVWIDEQLTAA